MPKTEELLTWCRECGPMVIVDEDGCCVTCGCDATGDVAAAIALTAERDAARGEVERLKAELAAFYQSPGLALAIMERRRQVTAEGWTPDHDDEHTSGELASAAACYLGQVFDATKTPPRGWPWADRWWKPKGGRIRQVTKGVGLGIAELDRLLRAQARAEKVTS